MKSFRIIILGGGMVAGYAAKEFVAQSGNKGELAIVTAENALPYERPPLSKGFLAGKDPFEDPWKAFWDKDFPEVVKDWQNEKPFKLEKYEKNEKPEKPEKYEKFEKKEAFERFSYTHKKE